MDSSEAQQRLDEIQRIVQRTTLNTRLPGWPAIIAGGIVLAGSAASYFLLGGSMDYAALVGRPVGVQWGFCILWAAVAIVSLGQEVVLGRLAAAKNGELAARRPGRLAVLSLTPSVGVAIALTLKILLGENVKVFNDAVLRLMPPIWMMCYGTGVYAAGLFSTRLPRMLGAAFIVLGAAGLLPRLEQYGLLLIAASFGLLHILFGLLVLRRDATAGGG